MPVNTPPPDEASPALIARAGGAQALAKALADSRHDTLRTFEAFEAACPGLWVPQKEAFNPPLWELGHVGWFQERWIARNLQRSLGSRADPGQPRGPSQRPDADALYDSGQVPHASRWSLPLPDAARTRADLAAQLAQTLDLLAAQDTSVQTLYFFRLALLHEDMHHEAALYMARCLDAPITDPRWQCPVLSDPGPALKLPDTRWVIGSDPDAGFTFDNECGHQEVAVAAGQIDAQVLRWHEYLPFVQAGGYAQAPWWSAAGWQWLHQDGASPLTAPRYLCQEDGEWLQWRDGQWAALELREPACHLTHHEAQAWCRWAGRRLPTEAEWERAVLTAGTRFIWGQVWEWTDSAFAPLSGFTPHPYRDYSLPWFDGRPVLRGGSFLTQPRMRHPRYRNFFHPGRNDIAAGFRSCAV